MLCRLALTTLCSLLTLHDFPERDKLKDELVLCNELLKKNEAAENKMFKVAAVVQGNFMDLPIDAFKKPTVPELTAFKHVRTFDTGGVPRGKSHLIPKKKEI